MDIVIAGKDEDEFTEIARKLEDEELLFIKNNKGFFNNKQCLNFAKAPEREKLTKNIDIIYALEESKRKDFIHHRNSGLNHILAKICNEKDIIVAFSFSSVLKNNPAVILGRMKQNVKLCRKYKVKMCFASFAEKPYEMRSIFDLKSFAAVIGMSPGEIKKSLSVLKERMEYNKKKAAGKIPTKGVEILD